jgi:hypothetical protein
MAAVLAVNESHDVADLFVYTVRWSVPMAAVLAVNESHDVADIFVYRSTVRPAACSDVTFRFVSIKLISDAVPVLTRVRVMGMYTVTVTVCPVGQGCQDTYVT